MVEQSSFVRAVLAKSPEGGVVIGGDPRGWQREHALKPEFGQVVFILRSIQ